MRFHLETNGDDQINLLDQIGPAVLDDLRRQLSETLRLPDETDEDDRSDWIKIEDDVQTGDQKD